MSGAASAQYDVECPICHAAPYHPCRTLTTHRVTDTHIARINAPRPNAGNTEWRCTTTCDKPGCRARCHEEHEVPSLRKHIPLRCIELQEELNGER